MDRHDIRVDQWLLGQTTICAAGHVGEYRSHQGFGHELMGLGMFDERGEGSNVLLALLDVFFSFSHFFPS